MTFRVRALDANGDMTFGRSAANFLVDSPAAVGQCVATRLGLWQNQWWLDLTEGTPWYQQILDSKNPGLAEDVLRARVLGTPYVLSVENFSASFVSSTRAFSVTGSVNTAFGKVTFDYPVVGIISQFTLGGSPLGGNNGGLGA